MIKLYVLEAFERALSLSFAPGVFEHSADDLPRRKTHHAFKHLRSGASFESARRDLAQPALMLTLWGVICVIQMTQLFAKT